MGIANLTDNDTLNMFLYTVWFQHYVPFSLRIRWSGDHFGFDISRSSKVKCDFPPHLKINLLACRNYLRHFMLFSQRAESPCLPAVRYHGLGLNVRIIVSITLFSTLLLFAIVLLNSAYVKYHVTEQAGLSGDLHINVVMIGTYFMYAIYAD